MAEERIEGWRVKYREALHILPGDISGSGDLLKVARTEARKKYGWEGVRVLPWVKEDPDGCYIVLVEPKSPPDEVVREPAGKAGAQGEDGAAEVQAREVAGQRPTAGES